MDLAKDDITKSLRIFVERRDALLHEDESAFDHHLQRFITFCQTDELAKRVIDPVQLPTDFDIEKWWQEFFGQNSRNDPVLSLPDNPDEEFAVRYRITASVVSNFDRLFQFGHAFGKRKRSEWIDVFRSIVIRPFAEEMSHRIGEAANLATPQERALQAVPLARIPNLGQTKIFLSHKNIDKSIVNLYYYALKELGFLPWLDEPNMPAGANFEREIFRGFQESCAAVFFVTENFKDEKYLAAEVDYAIMQKRNKDKQFAIITLRYSDAAKIPDLLTPYIYKTVKNDLEGFHQIIRSLPIELGPVRWRAEVIS